MSGEISTFDQYARAAWERFVSNPERAQASFEMVGEIDVERVLDAGCGAGHELLPFVRKGAFAVGLDRSPDVGRAGRELFAAQGYPEGVRFIRSAAEALPFPSGLFDLVICRLVLPYTDNASTLMEFARVLRPGGALLLKIHHARYYVRQFGQALLTLNFLSMIHALRVLLAGVIYHLTSRQPRGYFPSSETFQTRWLLQREAKRAGLVVRSRRQDPNYAPSFLLTKLDGNATSVAELTKS